MNDQSEYEYQCELARLEDEEYSLLEDDNFEERQEREDEERVFECHCGAWYFDKNGHATLRADCIC